MKFPVDAPKARVLRALQALRFKWSANVNTFPWCAKIQTELARH